MHLPKLSLLPQSYSRVPRSTSERPRRPSDLLPHRSGSDSSATRIVSLALSFSPPVDYVWTRRNELSRKRLIIFIDNSAALSALIRGDSISGIAAALVAVFWYLAQQYNICIGPARVGSNLNIADLPTRHVRIAFLGEKLSSFTNLFQLLSDILRWRIAV